ncbi:uncharacterized protein LOC128720165 [Anopheles nili]|uniref:uncharacterized protein LOC128720165 n=1 Tax=Anopheles nili TaxID=185578 RepID=UPI00237A8563|nr:uncharacterized protein LOC128720165 [Anopheles nili]
MDFDKCKHKMCIAVCWLILVSICYQIKEVSGTEQSADGNSPYETQTAQCTITSGDIEASAQASISKTLVGVCGMDDMMMAFQTLEMKLLEEMHNLRKMIRDPSFNPPPLRPSIFKSVKQASTSSNTSSNTALPQSVTIRPVAANMVSSTPTPAPSGHLPPTTTGSSNVFFPDDNYDEDEEESQENSNSEFVSKNSDHVKMLSMSVFNHTSTASRISNDDEKAKVAAPAIAFKPIDKPIENKFLTGGLRDYEVYRFNNTIISSGDAKVFKYFWKIEHFMKQIRSSSDINAVSFLSPVFVISGLNLRLHGRTINHAKGDVFQVQLEQLSAFDDALIKTPNVILAYGALYGQVETKTFFRHTIMILNQDKPFSDLISTDLTNTDSMFEAPLAALTTEPYLKNDKLLIKVIIFL